MEQKLKIRTLMLADTPRTVGDVRDWIEMVSFLPDDTRLQEGILAVDLVFEDVAPIRCADCGGLDVLGISKGHDCDSTDAMSLGGASALVKPYVPGMGMPAFCEDCQSHRH